MSFDLREDFQNLLLENPTEWTVTGWSRPDSFTFHAVRALSNTSLCLQTVSSPSVMNTMTVCATLFTVKTTFFFKQSTFLRRRCTFVVEAHFEWGNKMLGGKNFTGRNARAWQANLCSTPTIWHLWVNTIYNTSVLVNTIKQEGNSLPITLMIFRLTASKAATKLVVPEAFRPPITCRVRTRNSGRSSKNLHSLVLLSVQNVHRILPTHLSGWIQEHRNHMHRSTASGFSTDVLSRVCPSIFTKHRLHNTTPTCL